MPYNHEHGHVIIPLQKGDNDVEPALEAVDPFADKALDHLVVEHRDLFSVFEKTAYDLSGGDPDVKMQILKGMARVVVYLEQRIDED